MQKKEGLFNNRLLSLIIMVAFSVSVLALYKFNTETDNIAKSLITPINMETIDSSNCIVCHTDGNIIASLAVVSDASAHGAEGG